MTRDQVMVVLISAGWAGSVGVLGLAVAWFTRRWSVRWLMTLVALVAVLAVVAGVVGTSRAMFLSGHDFAVVLLVCLCAGLVGLLFAAAVGAAIVRWSEALRVRAEVFGDSGEYVDTARGPAEFTRLSAELARTSDRLRASREREQVLEGSRRELVTWVSHDLRTPLAGLRAMTEALEDGMVADPSRYHQRMRAEVDRMVQMVDDLFELSRIHAGVLRPEPVEVLVRDLVSEAIAGADPVARAAGVRLGGDVPEGLTVRVDPAGLSRVVANLLMNAIRHTPADGTVCVEGRPVDGGVELSVRDACGGIPEEDLARVFDVAWRGSPARTPVTRTPVAEEGGVGRDGTAGAGLGLSIVRGIVEAHAGRVTVVNEAPGCRFSVVLPT